MPIENHIPTWYDTEVRFDLLTRWGIWDTFDKQRIHRSWLISSRYLRPCVGEKIFEVLDPVEDTKGNNGETGKLLITNLRLIWQSKKFPKINLCKSLKYFKIEFDDKLFTDITAIGYNPITSINIKSVASVSKQLLIYEWVDWISGYLRLQKLRGVTESLHVLAKTKSSRYEFIFTNLVMDNNRLFSVVLAVHKWVED